MDKHTYFFFFFLHKLYYNWNHLFLKNKKDKFLM